MNVEMISWIIIAEAALPFVILSVILIVVIIRSRKKSKEAARKLILKIKNNEESQKSKVMDFLTSKLSTEESEAKKITKKIINERKFLFRNLISAFLDKNDDAIAMLESDLSRIVDHYHNLDVATQPAPPEQAEVVDDKSEEYEDTIEELKKEVKSLKHEVHVTLTTLNNIFAEFSSMFGEEVPDTEMSVDQIITAMKTFSNKAGDDNSADEPPPDNLFAEEDEPDAFAENIPDIDFSEEEDIDFSKEGDMAENEPEIQVPGADSLEPVDGTESDEEETLDFSIDSELDDIDSALDELELGQSSNDEPSWDEAFEESGDKKSDEN